MHLNIATIVLNGMPWIERHLAIFRRLTIPWTWSIVHGIADPVNDTAWCKPLDFVEDDGTRLYLHHLLSTTSDNEVRVRMAPRWPGKTVQINAAVAAFTRPGILLQVDSDELWTAEQLEILVRLFEAYPAATDAIFAARVFFGPKRVATQPNAYGNRWAYEWRRAWRFRHGMLFSCHEPPILSSGANRDAITLGHTATMAAGLVFDHHSYATAAQVAFKERFYGYSGALAAWMRLQEVRGPVDLAKFLPWVGESVMSYEIP